MCLCKQFISIIALYFRGVITYMHGKIAPLLQLLVLFGHHNHIHMPIRGTMQWHEGKAAARHAYQDRT